MLSEKISKILLTMPLRLKTLAVLFCAISMSLFSIWMAFTLRLEQWHYPNSSQIITYFIATFGFIPVLWSFGVYKTVLRYITVIQLGKLAVSVFVFGLIFFLLLEFAQIPTVPRSVAIIHPIIFAILTIFFRLVASTIIQGSEVKYKKNVLIFGAGEAGIQLASALKSNSIFHVAGFLDDNEKKHGRILLDAKISNLSDAAARIEEFSISNVFLAAPSISAERRREIISHLANLDVKVSTLPSLSEIMSAKKPLVATEALKPEDFLPIRKKRLSVQTPQVQGKTVFVTGAGGSIGSEICRQLLKAKVAKLVCIEHSEFNLYKIDTELRGVIGSSIKFETEIVSVLVDVKNEHDLRGLFNKFSPDIVYHAAAYKHVPLAEDNSAQVYLNNSHATNLVANMAAKYNVEKFILVSTDKAVRPTNVMGATKRIAELIIQDLAKKPNNTIFTMVRFGNVIGSSGSAIPLFQSQIANGGPVTVTHPEITRYFMSISDAVSLVLTAGDMAKGGELFVLDMGKPHKVLDVVKKMISLNGLTIKTLDYEQGDIEIKFIGLRPGEKMYEELVLGDNLQPTEHTDILTANEVSMEQEELENHLSTLSKISMSGNRFALINYLKDMSVLIDQKQA